MTPSSSRAALHFTDLKNTLETSCRMCHQCLKRCYAYQKTGIPVLQRARALFRGTDTKRDRKDVTKFLKACLYCKHHEHACVNGLDLTLMLPALKYELRQRDPDYTWSPQNVPSFLTRAIASPRFYYFWRNLNHALIPAAFRAAIEEHRDPRPREVVFFSGCGIQLLENQYLDLCDIFEKLGVDFGLLDGSYRQPVCCGTIHFEMGNFAYGKYMLRNLLREVRKFGTKKVVVYCATCYFGLTQLAPQLVDGFDLEVQHASGYLADFLRAHPEKQELLAPPRDHPGVVTVHDSCHIAHAGDTHSIRNLLSLLPGTRLAEMRHHKQHSLCDLYYVLAAARNPLRLLLKNNNIPIIDEAVDTGAEVLCSLCPGCHALLTIFGSDAWTTLGLRRPRIPVQNWVALLAGFLGIRRKDMLTHRFSHLLGSPWRQSGAWYLWQGLKAGIRGFAGRREPKDESGAGLRRKLPRVRRKQLKKLARLFNRQSAYFLPVLRPLLEVLDFVITERQADFLLAMGPSSYSRADLEARVRAHFSPGEFTACFQELISAALLWSERDAATGEALFKVPPMMLGWFELSFSDARVTPEKREVAHRLERYFRLFRKFNVFPARQLINLFYRLYGPHWDVSSVTPVPGEVHGTSELDKTFGPDEPSEADKPSEPGEHPRVTSTKGARVVPVEQGLEHPEYAILTSRAVQHLIERYGAAGQIAVTHCMCRQKYALQDEPCRLGLPLETHLWVGGFSEHVVKYGFGRLVSTEEALALVAEVRRKGGIHQVMHQAMDVDRADLSICSCCWDCCTLLGGWQRGMMPLCLRAHVLARVDAAACAGCGTCVDFCPVEAIVVVDGTARHDEKRCIGCGQCQFQCPHHAVRLEPDERTVWLPLKKRSARRPFAR